MNVKILNQMKGFCTAIEKSSALKLFEGEDKLYRELIEQAHRSFPEDPVVNSIELRIGEKHYRNEAIAALRVILGTVE